MAASTIMQSLLTAPVAGRSRTHQFLPAVKCAPSLRRNAGFRVRSMQQEENQEQPPTLPVDSAPLKSEKPTSPPKPSTNFFDIFAFDGPAPERINGRLAMVGFVAALAVELSAGQNLFAQLQTGGVQWFLGTSAVLTLASLIPQVRGITAESKSEAPMTSDAELWNGRLAMLGIVALALTEYIKGGALV